MGRLYAATSAAAQGRDCRLERPRTGAVRPWQMRQGQRIVEGDISLGPLPRPGDIEPAGLGLAGNVGLWSPAGGR